MLRGYAVRWKRRWERSQDDALKQLYLPIYLRHKVNYEEALMNAKKESWRAFLISQDIESIWKKAYTLCKKKTRAVPSSVLKPDGTHTLDSLSTAEFMINAFLPDDCTEDDSDQHRYARILADKEMPSTPNDVPFTKHEVAELVKVLNDKKAPGPDGFSANIIKHIFTVSPDFITLIYNKCLLYYCFPTAFKQSWIVAVPKPGAVDSTSPKAWRPISLISVFGKLLEKLWINRINYHLRSNGLLCENQFGFTPRRSTIDAISTAKEFISSVRSRGQYGVIVSLDVSGAFDAAWWPAIIRALLKRRVPSNLVHLCKDYFRNRTATLAIGSSTVSKNITRGCPQGSACGPSLWNLLYDDVLKLSLPSGCKLWALADDLALSAQARSPEELQRAVNTSLEMIAQWGRAVKLLFNETKTKVMVVRVGRRQFAPNVRMLGARLEIVEAFKYLGVYLDSRLSWREHFKYLRVKLNKIYGTFARLARNTFGLKSNVCIELYKVAIEPALLYAVQVWGYVYRYKWATNELTKIQRSFLLRSCKAYRTVSADALCVIANVTPISLRISEIIQIYDIKKCGSFETNEGSKPVQIPSARMTHPARRMIAASLDIDGTLPCPSNASQVIYTDGSGSENGIGSAFVVYRNGYEIHSEMFKLPSYCSVFQAELCAIQRALSYADPQAILTIYSDSRSSLQAIGKHSDNDLVISIQEKLAQFSVMPRLSWVKAHVGIAGNERADELAKMAATAGATINMEVPMSFVKRSIRMKNAELWNIYWMNSNKGLCTRLFFPTIAHRSSAKYLEPDFVITQFLSGHGKFAEYLSRFRIWRSGACECGALQEPHHLIRSCPATASIRMSIPHLNLNSPFGSQCDFDTFSDYLKRIHKLLLSWELHR